MVDLDTEDLGRKTQEFMDRYLDDKETFSKEIRDIIESEYRKMWAEKLKWYEEKKKEERP